MKIIGELKIGSALLTITPTTVQTTTVNRFLVIHEDLYLEGALNTEDDLETLSYLLNEIRKVVD